MVSAQSGSSATCYGAYSTLGTFQSWINNTLAVFGQGPVGLSATQLGVAMGARVIALDVNAERRALAESMGADVAIDPASDRFPETGIGLRKRLSYRAAYRGKRGTAPITAVFGLVADNARHREMR